MVRNTGDGMDGKKLHGQGKKAWAEAGRTFTGSTAPPSGQNDWFCMCVQYLRSQRGSETGWTDRSRPRERNGQPAGSVPAGLILTQKPTLCKDRKKTIEKADWQRATVAPRSWGAGAFACGGAVWGLSLQQMQLPPPLTLPFLPLLLERGPGGNMGNALLMMEH